MKRGVWSEEEHARFLQAIRYYPEGPWSKIAGCIGTRSPRQVQTHAQRYYEKVQRHVRGLQRDRSKSTHKEHRIDEDILRLQHLQRVAKAAAKNSVSTSENGMRPDQTEPPQEPQRRLYRSKDPPPCLQRLAGLPPQQSPVGVHDTGMISPRYAMPTYDYQHHQQYPHPISPVYDQSKVLPNSLQYARYDASMGYQYPPSHHQQLPSPHHQHPQRGHLQSMPLLPPITTKVSEPLYHHHAYGNNGQLTPSPTGRSSPHDSQVISSSIRSTTDEPISTTPRLLPPGSVGRPTLSWSQPGLLLPRIFS
jgi:SHAQKYF class myb-like DNA-binding protein